MSDLLLQKVLAKLDFLCLEYHHADGYFSCIGEPPPWSVELFSCIRNRFPRILPLDISSFLDNFMIDAVEFWQSQSPDILRSGYWTESSPLLSTAPTINERREVNLEALVLSIDNRSLLLLEVSAFRFDETQKWLQLARRERLDSMLERKANASQMTSLSLYDSLTGFSNEQAFTIQLAQWLEQIRRGFLSQFVLLKLNVDRFRGLNFSLGIERGDQCLIQIAKRIKAYLGEQDVIARLGSDEFAVLVRIPSGLSQTAWVKRLMVNLRSPYRLGRRQVYVTVSLGLLNVDDGSWDVDQCLLRSAVALSQAKSLGRGQVAIFEPRLEEQNLMSISQEQQLLAAIAHQGLLVNFQPIFSAQNRQIVGVKPVLDWPDASLLEYPQSELKLWARKMGLEAQLMTYQLKSCIAFSRDRPIQRPLTFLLDGSLQSLIDPQFQETINQFNQTLQQGDQVWLKLMLKGDEMRTVTSDRAIAFAQLSGIKLCVQSHDFLVSERMCRVIDETQVLAIALDATSFPFQFPRAGQLSEWKSQNPQGILLAEHLDEMEVYEQAIAISEVDLYVGDYLSAALPQNAFYQRLQSA